MAWATPTVFVSGNVLTAAQLNVLSSDLNETAPARASAAGQIFVSSAANVIAARTPSTASVETSETTTTIAAYGNLATVGPAVTVTTGTTAFVCIGTQIANSTGTGGGLMSFEVSGATTIAAPASTHTVRYISSNANEASTSSRSILMTGLTAGSNTFTAKYTTPTGGTATFQFRDITVIPF